MSGADARFMVTFVWPCMSLREEGSMLLYSTAVDSSSFMSCSASSVMPNLLHPRTHDMIPRDMGDPCLVLMPAHGHSCMALHVSQEEGSMLLLFPLSRWIHSRAAVLLL